MCVRSVAQSCLIMTLRTVVCQAPLSMGFPGKKYLNGLPFRSPGDLSHPGIELSSPALADRFFTTDPPVKPLRESNTHI